MWQADTQLFLNGTLVELLIAEEDKALYYLYLKEVMLHFLREIHI